jgi:MFS family permease
MTVQAESTEHAAPATTPARPGLVLLALILVAGVANLNLAVANVALPSIGAAFDASQTSLNLIAVGYSLGLAASVLYFGAVGDRYGRKMMLLAGTALAIPFSVLAARSPNERVVVARVGGGLSASMAYPRRWRITALVGAARTRAIALWSGIAASGVGPMLSGFMPERFWWGRCS